MRRSLFVGAVLVVVAGVVVSLAAGSAASGSSGRWVVRDLGTFGGWPSRAIAVNERGWVVGCSGQGDCKRGFLWRSGSIIGLRGLAGATAVEPVAINDRGQIVSNSWSEAEEISGRPFLWQGGRVTPLAVRPTSGRFSTARYRWSGTHVVAVNARGEIVGYTELWLQQDPFTRTLLWHGTTTRDLGPFAPGTEEVAPAAISDLGQVVGEMTDYERRCMGHAFLWTGGRMADLGCGAATDINERGQIVGVRETKAVNRYGEDVVHAFLWQRGKMRDLGTLRTGWSSTAIAINDQGQVVGASDPKQANLPPRWRPARAFVWSGGTMIDLGSLKAGWAMLPTAINNPGQIVGYAAPRSEGTRDYRAFVWDRGALTALPALGGRESSASALNNHGQIVGWATTKTGQRHAVLWTWQPAK